MKKLEERNFLKAEGTFYVFARDGEKLRRLMVDDLQQMLLHDLQKMAEWVAEDDLDVPDDCVDATFGSLSGVDYALREIHGTFGDNLIFAMDDEPTFRKLLATTVEAEDGKTSIFEVSTEASTRVIMMTKDRKPFGEHAMDLLKIAEEVLVSLAQQSRATVLEITFDDGTKTVIDLEESALAECEKTEEEPGAEEYVV